MYLVIKNEGKIKNTNQQKGDTMKNTADRTYNQKNLVVDIYRMTEMIQDRKYHNPTMALHIAEAAKSFKAADKAVWGFEYDSLNSRVRQLEISATNMVDED